MEVALSEFLTTVEGAITLYGPAVVSIISMIATIFVAIMKFKNSAKDSFSEIERATTEIRSSNKDTVELKKEIASVMRQNAELKTQISESIDTINGSIESLKCEVQNVKEKQVY